MADSVEGDHTMPKHDDHVKVLDKKITELSDALAHLGKGTDLKDLIKIIRFPGYTNARGIRLYCRDARLDASPGCVAGQSERTAAGSRQAGRRRTIASPGNSSRVGRGWVLQPTRVPVAERTPATA
jgi:hypothetical protein